MAKGPIVTTEVEVLIASVYKKHPKWKAKEVHKEVSYILHKQDSKLPPGWPGLSIVQKVLATVRKNMKETPMLPEDKPWSMGTLNEYPIPPDALPAVLKVWKLCEEKNYRFKNFPAEPFTLTIRQAKWAGRLAHVVEDTEMLSIFAGEYAGVEQTIQRLRFPLDTFPSRALDYDLMKPDRPLPNELKVNADSARRAAEAVRHEIEEATKHMGGKTNER